MKKMMKGKKAGKKAKMPNLGFMEPTKGPKMKKGKKAKY